MVFICTLNTICFRIIDLSPATSIRDAYIEKHRIRDADLAFGVHCVFVDSSAIFKLIIAIDTSILYPANVKMQWTRVKIRNSRLPSDVKERNCT